jgi:glycosyltransferase involved in cell wall biosynthesis
MRVLHVLPSLDQSYGGPLRAVLDLSAHSQSTVFQSDILGFGLPNIPDNPVPWKQIHSLKASFPRGYCYSRVLPKWLHANLYLYDGVILHGMWLYPNWAVSRACRALRKPYIYFPHGMLEPWSVFRQGPLKAVKKVVYWQLFERKIVEGATTAVFTTQREQQLASATFTLPKVPSTVVPYGVAVAGDPVNRPSNASLLLRPEESIALFLGRLHPKKNLPFLIRAWANARLGPTWRLLVAGPGERSYVSKLQRLARTLGVGQQVSFVSMVSGSDKSYLLQHAKWFLLPSQQENFGNAVLEAIQHGCPVAVSDQVYLSEFFHEAAEVLPLSHDAWVDFIRHRMTDERRRFQIIEMDRTHLLARFNIAKVSKQWAESLTEIFSSAQPPSNCLTES